MHKYILFLLCVFIANPAMSDVLSLNTANDTGEHSKSPIYSKNFPDSTSRSDQSLPATDSLSNLMQVTFGLFVIILLIVAAAWFTRKFGNFQVAAKGNLRVVGGLPLGARERVVLIQVGSEQIVLGVAPGRISKIHVLENPVPIEPGNEFSKSNFALKLSDIVKGYKGK